MQWQDLIITFGQIVFSAALLPMIFSKDKPVLISSLITGFVLMIYAATYITMQLWFGAAMTTLTGAIWLILAYQKFRVEKSK